MGMSLSKYVVTEAGFGADLGAEKFLNIKCVSAGLSPKALVLVATIRALRHHGGAKKDEYNTPSLEKVRKGISNLNKHIENCKKFGLNPVVAINAFPSDSKDEVDFIVENCQLFHLTHSFPKQQVSQSKAQKKKKRIRHYVKE